MDQVSMFEMRELDAYEKIKPALVDCLEENGLTGDFLSFQKRRSYCSVYFNRSSVVVRIRGGESPFIEIPHNAIYTRTKLRSLEEIQTYQPDIVESLRNILDQWPKQFDCCHRFKECSDAKKCIHPDKAFALDCGYRKILKSGRIFYGENRNI